jgi:hypothetical protein
MFNVDWVSSFRSAVFTQRFVDAFKKQASSRYRLKNWPVFAGCEPWFDTFCHRAARPWQDPAELSGKALLFDF